MCKIFWISKIADRCACVHVLVQLLAMVKQISLFIDQSSGDMYIQMFIIFIFNNYLGKCKCHEF